MKPLQSLLQKEVTRKEFLTISGFAVASLFGMGTIIKIMTGKGSEHHLKQYTDGYGSTDYGGKK